VSEKQGKVFVEATENRVGDPEILLVLIRRFLSDQRECILEFICLPKTGSMKASMEIKVQRRLGFWHCEVGKSGFERDFKEFK
jgi:hypothetical protein